MGETEVEKEADLRTPFVGWLLDGDEGGDAFGVIGPTFDDEMFAGGEIDGGDATTGAGAGVGVGTLAALAGAAAAGAGAGAGAVLVLVATGVDVGTGMGDEEVPEKTAPFSRLTSLGGAVLPEKNSPAVKDGSADGAGG